LIESNWVLLGLLYNAFINELSVFFSIWLGSIAGMMLSIREMSKKLGVHEQTLRNWERQGLLKVSRVGGNRTRVYGEGDVSVCRKIRDLSEQGVNLRGIKALFSREKVDRTP
jgi:transposase-like protein